MLPVSVKMLFAVIVTLLVMSLTGCAAKLQTPPERSLQLPPPPSLSTPLPPTNYSLTAADAIKTWLEKLMGTRLMREHSTMPGQ